MSVVMLSGPIGAGKTTVARELVAISPAPLCYIEGDAFWSLFAKADTQPRRKRFRVLMRSVTAAAVALARSGYEVLLDFSFPLDSLETGRKIVKEIPLDFVMLRPSIAICKQRAATRPEGKISNYNVYRDFYTMFEGLPKHEIGRDAADAGPSPGGSALASTKVSFGWVKVSARCCLTKPKPIDAIQGIPLAFPCCGSCITGLIGDSITWLLWCLMSALPVLINGEPTST
jgi:hypothetical protein